MALRTKVFISYAHEDTAWKNRFVSMLAPAVDQGSIGIWSDGEIPVGAKWASQIDDALASAAAALLLVTPSFLESDFIKDVELPRLLNLAKTQGVEVWWVPISPSLISSTPLKDIQAVTGIDKPLESLSAADQNAAIQRICQQMVDQFGCLPKVTPTQRKDVTRRIQERLGDRYDIGDEVGAGRFSLVFKAQQKKPSRTVAVKVFVASEFDDWAVKAFDEAVKRGANLTSGAFLKIIEVVDAPRLLVTEFVNAEPLSKYLHRYPNGVPLPIVRRILRDLAVAIEELHARGEVRGELCPSNILIQGNGFARISTADMVTILGDERIGFGDFRVDRESLAYMTPERFYGRRHTALSDQFSLGLIALELLGGSHVPRITCPKDLVDKCDWFKSLDASEDRWARRSEAFAGLVSRLLRFDPEDRWASMSAIRRVVQDIEIAESEDDRTRRLANASYVRLQSGGKERAFVKRFYANLFAASRTLNGTSRPPTWPGST
jgi:hypothetical protein